MLYVLKDFFVNSQLLELNYNLACSLSQVSWLFFLHKISYHQLFSVNSITLLLFEKD